MDKAAALAAFDTELEPWTAALATILPSTTREPGVCGTWTIHDVVNHVHHYARYHLAQVRAAFSHVPPSTRDIQGARDEMRPAANSLDARNEAMRLSGLSLTWHELVEESRWLRDQTHQWVGGLTPSQLDERVGWVNFWDPNVRKPDNLPIHVRRVTEAPGALATVPVWQFLLHGDHVVEHLGHIRAWQSNH